MILHIAVEEENVEIVNKLLSLPEIDVNSKLIINLKSNEIKSQ